MYHNDTTMYYSDVVPQWYYRYDTTMYNSNTTKYNVVLQWCTTNTMYYNVSWYYKIYIIQWYYKSIIY